MREVVRGGEKGHGETEAEMVVKPPAAKGSQQPPETGNLFPESCGFMLDAYLT